VSADGVLWSYALSPDVTLTDHEGAARLHSGAVALNVADGTERELVAILSSGERLGEAGMLARLSEGGGTATAACCAALLYRLDRTGFLERTIGDGRGPIATCLPLRQPDGPRARGPRGGTLRLSPAALAFPRPEGLVLEAPGTWARVILHDRALAPVLHDLAAGATARQVAAAFPDRAPAAIDGMLAMMAWCGLLAVEGDRAAPVHRSLMHARTRAGLARAPLGRLATASASHTASDGPEDKRACIVLERPDRARLATGDPPHFAAGERRRSVRHHGHEPLDRARLSEFLFRTLGVRNGRRSYPSGGAIYPLRAWLAVGRCRGVPPGLHAYDHAGHHLRMVAEPGRELNRLLRDAAGASGVSELPHMVLVLSVRFAEVEAVYADIAYALILKEVGAVFQAAMTAAAAMEIASCPLGTGDSMLFAALTGHDPLVEGSVGEMTIGSLPAGS